MINLEGKRWIAYIPPTTVPCEDGYRVSFVIENESGHFPTGDTPEGGQTEPWYWGPTLKDAEECAAKYNADRGISPEEADKILVSSMVASR